MHTIHLPYGNGISVTVNIPDKNFAGAYSSKCVHTTKSPSELTEHALLNPISSLKLHQLINANHNVLIVVDDNTRPTPVALILPEVLNILKDCGLADDQIRILFASGTHRAMTDEEKKLKVGESTLTRFECICHDYLGNCISLGTTQYGTPIEVNPLLKWSDFTIAIGSVVPHAYCGWGGGGKMILPGVSSARSILATHMLPYQHPEIGIGLTENRARTEIDEASQIAGLKFIINAVLSPDGDVVDIVAGGVVPAHRECIKRAASLQRIEIPESDLVFGCSYPEYSCYWQANKAFHPMERIVKPGGLAVMVASMPEGRGEHPNCFDAMGEPDELLIEQLNRMKDSDLDSCIAIACALADKKLQRKARVGIISNGLPKSENANGVFIRFDNPDDAVKMILQENENARITCLLNAPQMLPIKV